MASEFLEWFSDLDQTSQEAILSRVYLLKELGPTLGRPYVEAVKGSQLKKMKELRAQCRNQVYRVFFVFGQQRNAVLLIGDNKKGRKDREFYQKTIPVAESIYQHYRKKLEEGYHDNH